MSGTDVSHMPLMFLLLKVMLVSVSVEFRARVMNTNKYWRAAMAVYLVAGLSLSSGQNEDKSKTFSSEKGEKQESAASSVPNMAKLEDRIRKITNAIKIRQIDAAISELNGREALAWGDQALKGGDTDDSSIFQVLNQSLGRSYLFSGTVTGGSIAYEGSEKVALKRIASSPESPASWERVQKNPKGDFEIENLKELILDLPEGSEKERFMKIASIFRTHVIDAAISELNGREALSWGDAMLTEKGFIDDATVFKTVDQELEHAYSFTGKVTGGQISHQGGEKVLLKRIPSTATAPAEWQRASKKSSDK